MALTPPGSPYVESSDLVANYPAVSESLAERVDLVGVLPFASAAARTTALPTPTDGQYSYLQDTNATEYYDGAAWVAAGVAPGLVLVASSTFSAASAVNIDSCFSADYSNYEIIMSEVTASNASETRLRLRSGGVDNTSTIYDYIQWGNESSPRRSGFTYFVVGNCEGRLEPRNTLRLNQPFGTGNATSIINIYVALQTTGIVVRSCMGNTNVTTSFDGVSIYPSVGTITGTIRVYGYTKGA